MPATSTWRTPLPLTCWKKYGKDSIWAYLWPECGVWSSAKPAAHSTHPERPLIITNRTLAFSHGERLLAVSRKAYFRPKAVDAFVEKWTLTFDMRTRPGKLGRVLSKEGLDFTRTGPAQHLRRAIDSCGRLGRSFAHDSHRRLAKWL